MKLGRVLTARAILASAVWLTVATGAGAQTREAIRYTLRFPAPQTNYIEVEAQVPTEGRTSVDLMIPVWTPGSYLIREYERNVEAVVARAGDRTLAVDKPVKNRWRVATAGTRAITLTYRVYSHELTVRNNWVDIDFAMINGAQTFITLADSATAKDPAYNRPHDVRLELPAAWKTSVTGMPAAPDGAPNHYLAPDYDTLVDSPIVAGNPAIHRFTVDGKPHLLVDVGEGGVFDGERAVRDVERIVSLDRAFWGSLPYEKYVFFNLLTGAGGGLEHRNSVMLMASRWSTRTHARYIDWLDLVSHEYFHLWNVKRLRPIELGPFDYEHENYPRSLWISEGLTDYYALVQLARAQLISEREFLSKLSSAIRTLQTTPGRLTQTAEMASFDAWVKEYRPDENTINTTISYYTKGEVLGFVLDARIRAATNGAKSLDDVMRLAFLRYSGARGFTPEDFRRTASEVAAADLGAWFTRALNTTEELDYREALDWFGLQFRPPPPPRLDPPGWLGAKTKIDNGRLVVQSVPRGTPAYDAGLNPGDEIIGIDDYRVLPDALDTRLDMYRPGQKTTVVVTRLEEMKRLSVTLGLQPEDRWMLETTAAASADQRAHFAAFLR